jgi:hypothetical protein
MQDRIAGPAALSVTASPEGCGNDGPVESVENETHVSHASHRPLEISPTPRDFHIPTASACAGWKSGKPKPGFPLFHAAHATTTTGLSSNFKNQERKSAAARPPLPDFHDHLVLETNPRFMIILGLENALQGRHARHQVVDFDVRFGR